MLRTNGSADLRSAGSTSVIWLLMAIGIAVGSVAQAQDAATGSSEKETFFESKIRPLLVEHCVDCHGPDDQEGDLRLDRHEHFKAGGGSGPAVVAGDPNASRLIRAIGYQDNDLQMPPDSKLPQEAIELLTRWVQEGAYWPADKLPAESESKPKMSMAELLEAERQSHWSLQPIVAPEPPALESWPSAPSDGDAVASRDPKPITPIDRFVLARLSEANLSPNPPADRRTLIHRAHFTLIGLPPTYEEVQAFVADEDPKAFERLVDRLLESPHYGERWARHWLDIARYGDTMGYLAGSQETRYPFAYTYRDYVIDAFNHDKPFDQFIVEQLAADQLGLEGQQREALAAMGLLTVGRRFMNRRVDIIDDQIDVVTRGFLGLSVSCARCHDHKYDPVPTADYYSLYGVFDSSEEPAELPLLGEPEPSPEYEAFLQAKAAKQKEVDDWLDERRVATENELRSRLGDYLVFFANAKGEVARGKLNFQGERGPLRRGAPRLWQPYLTPGSAPSPIWVLWNHLAAIPEEAFAEKAPDVVAEAIRLSQAAANTDPETASTEPNQSALAIPNRLLTALQEAKPQTMAEAAKIFGAQMEAVYSNWVEARKANPELERLPNEEDEALRIAFWQPTSLTRDQMIDLLDQGERNHYNQLLGNVNGVEVTHPGAPPRGMVMVDKANPVEPVIFRRGVPGNRGDRVPRRFLQVLSHVDGGQPFQQGSGRLELAKAIASPDNPLTARVIVNRVWQQQFGAGLVRTPSDFGTRGEAPTHPELLDYLAAEFMADGWSIKRLQRRIILTATWQQSSELRADAVTADPENRCLWHMPRRRMEFEPLRDRLLVAAGRLDDRIGGRSVMIHQDATRRGLYAYIDREDLPGLLASFDVPSPDASQAQRTETTVPQQALYLMNSKFVIEQAKALAARTASESEGEATSREDRVRRMYQFALSRDPDEVELRDALRFVDPESVESFRASLDNRPDGETLAPWVQLAQVLLLCNEFAFVD